MLVRFGIARSITKQDDIHFHEIIKLYARKQGSIGIAKAVVQAVTLRSFVSLHSEHQWAACFLLFKLGPSKECKKAIATYRSSPFQFLVPGESMETVIHNGGCHCGRVKWQAEAPSSVSAVSCNCSYCSMRGSTAFVVPNAKFKLLGESERHLNRYTFGTHSAKHLFCNVCGITSFYIQRGNPDGVAVVVSCVDSGTLKHVQIRISNTDLILYGAINSDTEPRS
ncbi:hypothetical protein J5N97_006779 [Dioscorea zingiberensis]|uniref:CENP-V/GFA domain-containing protein n=1 Tax=Dioscorea zingiberensis TaxID=325984 RepID=A0A9D5DAQ9_9LILI|nr:hypothetical protein J5N97_006779 [Dioscorea zingiberensis]